MLSDLRRRYASFTWEPVEVGRSSAEVFRLSDDSGRARLFVKAEVGAAGAEAERLIWLGEHGIPVPQVVDYDEAWLVTSALAGRTAADPWPADQHDQVIAALAQLLREIHEIDPASCPFLRTLSLTVPHAILRAEHGLVDLADLDPERRGMSAAELTAALVADRPRTEELAVTHGDFCLPNVVLDPDTVEVIGVLDTGRVGVADRYSDLALVLRSLASPDNPQYPAGSGKRFLTQYGLSDPDPERIAFYQLLDEFF